MSERDTPDGQPGALDGLNGLDGRPDALAEPTVLLPVITPPAAGDDMSVGAGAYADVTAEVEVPEEWTYGKHAASVEPAELPPEVLAAARAAPDRAPPTTSVGRASGVMALGTIASRGTGFVRTLALAYVLGIFLVPDAYNAANTLPNMVYEFLLGGILTSVFIPLIVRAQKHDEDGGEAYTQRLMTITVLGLAAATVLAVLVAPLLISLQGFSAENVDQRHLAIVLARLLLPEIFFYGVAAAAAAILNTRGRFGAPMWAPALNNIVVIVTCGLFLAAPGPRGSALTPGSITSTQVLVLGVGTTLGIIIQAAALLPALRAVGYRWRVRLDWRNARLGEVASLAGWMLAYVLVSQIGVLVVQHLAVSVANHHPGVPGLSTFVYAQLLFMLPHGIIAVSIINALMPRMSGAAVDGRLRDVVRDLSFGTRMAAVVLLPVTAAFVVLGPLIGTVLYSHGATSDAGGRGIGVALANGALGLIIFAVSQLQIFAFYSLRDTRTPALVNLAVVAAKVAVDLLLYAVLPPAHVIDGLMWGNTASYAVCVVVSGVLLRRHVGRLDGARVLRTMVRLALAAAIGGGLAAAVAIGVPHQLGEGFGVSVSTLIAASVIGIAGFLSVAVLLGIEEVRGVGGMLRARLGR